MLITFNCKHCNKETTRYSKNRPNIFCSKSCSNKERLGIPTWNKGTKGVMKAWNKGLTREIDSRIIAPWEGKKRPEMSNENHYKWGGDSISYRGIHKRIRLKRGEPQECVYCGDTKNMRRLQWASIPHKATADIYDYIPLCVPCHSRYDRRARA